LIKIVGIDHEVVKATSIELKGASYQSTQVGHVSLIVRMRMTQPAACRDTTSDSSSLSPLSSLQFADGNIACGFSERWESLSTSIRIALRVPPW
jgi:hypothetical protein